jgi:hypothetical protein
MSNDTSIRHPLEAKVQPDTIYLQRANSRANLTAAKTAKLVRLIPIFSRTHINDERHI